MIGRRQDARRLVVQIADVKQREEIYRVRHAVYAQELHQHHANPSGTLQDALDEFNIYICVSNGSRLLGFISITPPESPRFSIEKYIERSALPFNIDASTFEVRLLTVLQPHRGRALALLLMYAAFRWIEQRGGTQIIGMGREQVLPLYRKLGLTTLDASIQAGDVAYQLIAAPITSLRHKAASKTITSFCERVQPITQWDLPVSFRSPPACYHGGAFFDAIGEELDDLERRHKIINADVLDAWFDPAPAVMRELSEHLPWILRTSPPTHASGLERNIAAARGVNAANILAGAGSSDLIFRALRYWLTSQSRVLILDPTYGEYSHVLENVISCRVERLELKRDRGYALDADDLERTLSRRFDLAVIVNPNSPTGHHLSRQALESILSKHDRTRFWIDETYIEYTGADQSLEKFAASTRHVMVCKSMSKVYALSGARVAYLCGDAELLGPLRSITPPWCVSLPAQIAATAALNDPEYYAKQYEQTHVLREQLTLRMKKINGISVIRAGANFVLCELSTSLPDAGTVVKRCRVQELYIRDASSMSARLGNRTIRIAVKDDTTNQRIVEILASVLT